MLIIVEVKAIKKTRAKKKAKKASISRRKKKKKEENELEKDTFLHIHSVCILKMYIFIVDNTFLYAALLLAFILKGEKQDVEEEGRLV